MSQSGHNDSIMMDVPFSIQTEHSQTECPPQVLLSLNTVAFRSIISLIFLMNDNEVKCRVTSFVNSGREMKINEITLSRRTVKSGEMK